MINVTLKAVKEEIKQDADLKDAPKVVVGHAIKQFVRLVEDDNRYAMTDKSKQAILKYAEGLVNVGK